MLGTLDARSMRRLSHRTSILFLRLSDSWSLPVQVLVFWQSLLQKYFSPIMESKSAPNLLGGKKKNGIPPIRNKYNKNTMDTDPKESSVLH